MFNMIRKLTLALSLAALSMTGVAFAEDSSKLPEPSSPERGTVVDGRVNVYIGTPRVNAYGIGDSIPVTLVFEMIPPKPEELNTQPAAPTPEASKPGEPAKAPEKKLLPMPRIDVEGLVMQMQSADKLDVDMLGGAQEVQRYTRDGKEYLRVVFYVWTFVTTKQTQVDVKADFMYAYQLLEDGTPDWRRASSPVIHVGIRRTANDNQTRLREGDLSLKASPTAAAAPYFMVGGALLLLPLFGALGLTGYRRYMQPKKLNANESAWAELDAIFTEAKKNGYNIELYKSIFFVLRQRFNVLAQDGHELFAALKAHPDLASVDYADIEKVFGMEAIFYAKDVKVTDEQNLAFEEGIKKLIPRH